MISVRPALEIRWRGVGDFWASGMGPAPERIDIADSSTFPAPINTGVAGVSTLAQFTEVPEEEICTPSKHFMGHIDTDDMNCPAARKQCWLIGARHVEAGRTRTTFPRPQHLRQSGAAAETHDYRWRCSSTSCR